MPISFLRRLSETGQRFLVTDRTAFYFSSFLGVLITLTAASLYSLLAGAVVAVIAKRRQRIQQTASLPQSEIPLQPIANATTGNASRFSHIELYSEVVADHVKHNTSFGGAAFRAFKSSLCRLRSGHRQFREASIDFLTAVAFTLLFIGITATAIASSNIILDSSAICLSDRCGFWYPSFSPAGSSLTSPKLKSKVDISKENAAALHEKKCMQLVSNSENCDTLKAPQVVYEWMNNTDCPFAHEMCALGGKGSYTLRTPRLGAEIVGINSPSKFSFERRMTCAPITVNSTYVRTSPKTENYRMTYLYGPYSSYDKEIEWTAQSPNNIRSSYNLRDGYHYVR